MVVLRGMWATRTPLRTANCKLQLLPMTIDDPTRLGSSSLHSNLSTNLLRSTTSHGFGYLSYSGYNRIGEERER